MSRPTTMLSSTTMPASAQRSTARSGPARHEGLKLAMGCVAVTVIALGLYLVAPATTRSAVVAAFLGFDQTFTAP